MKYVFGNAIADEEPAGLRDALTRIEEELARLASSVALTSGTTDVEGVTNNSGTNNDVMMMDALSSAPVRQQGPTIAVPETAAVAPSPTPPPPAPLASPEFGSSATTTENTGQESCTPRAQSPLASASPLSATPPLAIAPPLSIAPTSSVVPAPPVTSPPSVTPDAPTDRAPDLVSCWTCSGETWCS
ncbi:hypothetical protein FRC08_015897 [Ceratobasidium sp. 394]|nr:hypothetical protein FRC08_015897 [Ceratobasidium sp. 394]KAG9092468.1 hypothetical protein FS749_015730 [Ceratobasidium sp. UAMH 11750]